VRLGAEQRLLVRAAVAVARTATDFLPDGETRPGIAMDAAERWSRGEADEATIAAARGEVEALAANAPDPAVNAAAEAVLAALGAVDDPEAAPGAATQAAQAAVFDAGDCAMMPALRFAQEQAANAVREHLSATWAEGAFAARS